MKEKKRKEKKRTLESGAHMSIMKSRVEILMFASPSKDVE